MWIWRWIERYWLLCWSVHKLNVHWTSISIVFQNIVPCIKFIPFVFWTEIYKGFPFSSWINAWTNKQNKLPSCSKNHSRSSTLNYITFHFFTFFFLFYYIIILCLHWVIRRCYHKHTYTIRSTSVSYNKYVFLPSFISVTLWHKQHFRKDFWCVM